MAPVRGKSVALTRDMRVDAAFNTVLRVNAAHLRANEAGMLRGRDPEYLHQMRVALRRLRSAISVFAPVAPGLMKRTRADLRWISRHLGAARDWDVFVTETLPRIETDSRTRLSWLRARCNVLRRRAGARAARAVRSVRYRRFSRSLTSSRFVGARPAPRGRIPAALLQPRIDDYASAVLEWSDRRLGKSGAKPAALTARALHRFRIALKKFRYAAHFFSGLFESRAERVALKRLSHLQDILGAINDAAMAEQLVATATVGAPRDVREARSLVKRWSRRRTAALRHELAGAWKVFRAGGRFW